MDEQSMDEQPDIQFETAVQEFGREQLEVLGRILRAILGDDSTELEECSRAVLESFCLRSLKALSVAVEELNSLVCRVEDIDLHEEKIPDEAPEWTLQKAGMLKRHSKKLEKLEAEENQDVTWFEVFMSYHEVQHNGRLSAEMAEIERRKTKCDEDPNLSDAQKIIRAVANAAEAGKEWESGKDLTEWLSEEFPCSKSTAKRRLQEAGVWAKSRKGMSNIQETVKRCRRYFYA